MAVRRVCCHCNYNLASPDLLALSNLLRGRGMWPEFRQGRRLVGNLAGLLVGHEDDAVLGAQLTRS